MMDSLTTQPVNPTYMAALHPLVRPDSDSHYAGSASILIRTRRTPPPDAGATPAVLARAYTYAIHPTSAHRAGGRSIISRAVCDWLARPHQPHTRREDPRPPDSFRAPPHGRATRRSSRRRCRETTAHRTPSTPCARQRDDIPPPPPPPPPPPGYYLPDDENAYDPDTVRRRRRLEVLFLTAGRPPPWALLLRDNDYTRIIEPNRRRHSRPRNHRLRPPAGAGREPVADVLRTHGRPALADARRPTRPPARVCPPDQPGPLRPRLEADVPGS